MKRKTKAQRRKNQRWTITLICQKERRCREYAETKDAGNYLPRTRIIPVLVITIAAPSPSATGRQRNTSGSVVTYLYQALMSLQRCHHAHAASIMHLHKETTWVIACVTSNACERDRGRRESEKRKDRLHQYHKWKRVCEEY